LCCLAFVKTLQIFTDFFMKNLRLKLWKLVFETV
jgi:hypothetical protein